MIPAPPRDGKSASDDACLATEEGGRVASEPATDDARLATEEPATDDACLPTVASKGEVVATAVASEEVWVGRFHGRFREGVGRYRGRLKSAKNE